MPYAAEITTIIQRKNELFMSQYDQTLLFLSKVGPYCPSSFFTLFEWSDPKGEYLQKVLQRSHKGLT